MDMAKKNWEERYVDLMIKGFDEVKSQVAENTVISRQALDQATKAHAQAKKTNGRVTLLENKVDNLEKTRSWLNNVSTKIDSKTLYIIAIIILATVLIIAKLLGVNVMEWVKG